MISFILFLTVNIVVLTIVSRYYGNKYSTLSQAVICSLIFYVLAILWTFGTSIYLKNQLDSFDLDHDGFFSFEEQTSEQIETMEDFISDTGRNFAPIGALILTPIYFLIALLTLFIFEKAKIILVKNN